MSWQAWEQMVDGLELQAPIELVEPLWALDVDGRAELVLREGLRGSEVRRWHAPVRERELHVQEHGDHVRGEHESDAEILEILLLSFGSSVLTLSRSVALRITWLPDAIVPYCIATSSSRSRGSRASRLSQLHLSHVCAPSCSYVASNRTPGPKLTPFMLVPDHTARRPIDHVCWSVCDFNGVWGATVRCGASACPSRVDWRSWGAVVC
ncbi:hypothetical protein C7974DRAFT_402636 [Boeremia exigua]|uniref:uncharacterized protein n=1 Tax=Boeremia exigua TaxID=749465 RepID=UPI001E8E19CC|nr:uncharacterized protein C7974DRAFT_402636 [Boeremia exigua]KAH6616903.1 hypothetical protein C7974DRAFT_402636 [Boeremia exigua]